MRLYPALDILDGAVVRLAQGDYGRSTTYATEPLAAAREWREAGAERLHVVDLDGARAGAPVNLASVAAIVRETGLEVQLGGGLRSPAAVEAALAAGSSRVVIGTAAFDGSDFLERVLDAHGERIAVSVDARGGSVATSGWTQTIELAAVAAVEALVARGATRFIYSDVDRDGMLAGPDTAAVAAIADAVPGDLTYAGGIGELAHLRELAALRHPRLSGVIVGKALYEHAFTLAEAEAALCT
ncbi:MAG TPA: 1-(5-phosphoribosyl)-5-[(5-phosphoribosylamino)methylideneamino]imidazole-4-carboxamide isomerase [Solirubrobacteraceae bacterium]|nr:1-(5-phosphoribosyl)-5-[(5-phosphoribosylamino)methylideneamino]imidazole-4-carboxamide isomerase [Solirubrobacteraceae bacterium]